MHPSSISSPAFRVKRVSWGLCTLGQRQRAQQTSQLNKNKGEMVKAKQKYTETQRDSKIPESIWKLCLTVRLMVTLFNQQQIDSFQVRRLGAWLDSLSKDFHKNLRKQKSTVADGDTSRTRNVESDSFHSGSLAYSRRTDDLFLGRS